MTEARVSGELPIPHDQAWRLLSDLSRFGEWMTIHDSWHSEIPELRAGATVTEQLSVMGLSTVVEWTIDHYDPPSELRISGTGLAGAQIAFTLSVLGQGDTSTVTIDATFAGQLMVGAIGEAVQKNATIELEKSFENLKGLI